MIATQRFSHIMDNSICESITCPACHALVHVEDRVCPECGQYVNYKRNLDVLSRWDVDLFNYSIKEIKDGFAQYHRNFSSERYVNYYSLENGRSVIPERFNSCLIHYYEVGGFVIESFSAGHSVFGLLDMEGNEIISPVCDDIQEIDSKGRFIVKYLGKMGVVNTANQCIIPILYDCVKRASYSYEDFFIVEKDGQCGMLDAQNKIIIPIEFEAIGEYLGGPVSVCQNNRWGFYDISRGDVSIPFKFDKARSFSEGCARVQMGNDAFFIDEMGFPTLPESRLGEEVVEKGRVIVRDVNGQIAPGGPSKIGFWRNGIKLFMVDDKKGAINTDGFFVIPPEYDELFILEGGLFPARKGDRYGNNWGVLSSDGSCILPFNYSQTWVSDGLIRIRSVKTSGGPYLKGYVDRSRRTIIPQDYIELSCFEEGLCWYERWGPERFGIMDKFGNYVEYRPLVENGRYIESFI